MSGKRAAGFVVFRRIKDSIEYLLLQTSYGEHHWTPPKGHVDPGECDMETAFRETEEEAGLTKKDLKVVEGFSKTLQYDVKGKPKTVIYYLAEICGNASVKLSHEHQNFKWLELDPALDIVGYEDTQNLLKACHEFLRSTS